MNAPNANQKTDFSNVNLVDLIEQPAWKTILLDLVDSQKWDPWNIDIAQLADKYLQKINALNSLDLRIPANAILASAILLKAKARLLKIPSLEEEDKAFEKLIEQFIPELVNPRPLREGKVSLDALVEVIEQSLLASKRKAMKKFLEQQELSFKIPFPEFNVEEHIERIFSLIQEKTDSQGLVLFSRLLNGNSKDVNEIVYTFLTVLYLANKERITVWQDDFFGEIFISLNKESGNAPN